MGRASSQVFVREGAKVLAADISGGEEETAASLGDAVVACRVDVTKEADVEAMFAAALEAFGRVDAVLNVAGIGAGGMLADTTMEDYDRIFDVNLRGVLLGTKHGIKTMIPTGGGVIVNWSSIGGLGASLGTSVYSATKAGVISFTKNAAIEYGPQGIRANAICPGIHRDRDVGRPRRRRALPADDPGHGPEAGRPTRGGRRAGLLPGLGPGELRLGRHHPDRRWVDGPTGLGRRATARGSAPRSPS